jgi:hypothetical protein
MTAKKHGRLRIPLFLFALDEVELQFAKDTITFTMLRINYWNDKLFDIYYRSKLCLTCIEKLSAPACKEGNVFHVL